MDVGDWIFVEIDMLVQMVTNDTPISKSLHRACRDKNAAGASHSWCHL
jgi:hypothetical protein